MALYFLNSDVWTIEHFNLVQILRMFECLRNDQNVPSIRHLKTDNCSMYRTSNLWFNPKPLTTTRLKKKEKEKKNRNKKMKRKVRKRRKPVSFYCFFCTKRKWKILPDKAENVPKWCWKPGCCCCYPFEKRKKVKI